MHIQNYRELCFSLHSINIFVIAMAHPFRNTNYKKVLSYLSKDKQSRYFVSLEREGADIVRQEYIPLNKLNSYQLIDIEDYSPPSQEQFDNFFEGIFTLSGNGRVVIHCKAGIGRTGTMLSALALLEIYSMDSKTSSLERDEKIIVGDSCVSVTTAVFKAIKKVRSFDIDGKVSVETAPQVESLLDLEPRCQNILKIHGLA